MASFSFTMILLGNLQVILEFGSVTFLLVSFLMAYANFRIYKKTNSSIIITIISLIVLAFGTILIIYYEITTQVEQLYFIGGLYFLLTLAAWIFAKINNKTIN